MNMFWKPPTIHHTFFPLADCFTEFYDRLMKQFGNLWQPLQNSPNFLIRTQVYLSVAYRKSFTFLGSGTEKNPLKS